MEPVPTDDITLFFNAGAIYAGRKSEDGKFIFEPQQVTDKALEVAAIYTHRNQARTLVKVKGLPEDYRIEITVREVHKDGRELTEEDSAEMHRSRLGLQKGDK